MWIPVRRLLSAGPEGSSARRDSPRWVGDRVELRELGNGDGFIERILPRKNEFARPAVANIDQLVIIASAAIPKTDPFLIDRVAAIAELKGCDVTVLLNKCDLDPAGGAVRLFIVLLGSKHCVSARKQERGWIS